MYNRVIYNQNGTISVVQSGLNQPVQGNGRYLTPPGFGNSVRRIDLNSSTNFQGTIWSVNWYEPWKGNPLGGV